MRLDHFCCHPRSLVAPLHLHLRCCLYSATYGVPASQAEADWLASLLTPPQDPPPLLSARMSSWSISVPQGAIQMVSKCGNCVLITADDPTCLQDCGGLWYNSTPNATPSVYYCDECGYCVLRSTGRHPHCVQDCAGQWNGTAVLDSCGQCVVNNSPAFECLTDCAGNHYLASTPPLYRFDNCSICANATTFNQLIDLCGVCENTVGSKSTADCTVDCKGNYCLVSRGACAVRDACGDCFFANQTGSFDPSRCYSYCEPEVSGNAAWPETKAGLVATGICLASYFIPSTTRACLNENSIGVWDLPSSSCLPVYCSADVLDGVTFMQTLSSTVGQGLCPAGSFGFVTRNRTQLGPQGEWSLPVGTCQPCPLGTCQDQVGQLVCKQCPPNSNSPSNSTSAASSRSCLPGFVSQSGQCQALYCPQEYINNTTFPMTRAGSTAQGICDTGLTGSPSLQCFDHGHPVHHHLRSLSGCL